MRAEPVDSFPYSRGVLIAGFPAGSFRANCYVVAPGKGGECVVIDPGEGVSERLDALLDEHRLTPAAVLLTHGHLDHTASTAAVCDGAGIPAHIHGNDEFMLADPLAALTPELRGALARLHVGPVRPALVTSLTGVGEVQIAGLTIVVDHIPGHTPGSVAYRLAAAADRPEVLFTGDTLFAGSIGRTDLPGGDTDTILESISARLLSRPDDTVVLSGHGPATTIGAERQANPFLVGL